MPSENLVIERDGAVQWIRLNRPGSRNMIDLTTRTELADAFVAADSDSAVRAIVVTGTGRDFCTGGDLAPPAGGDGEPAPPGPLDYRRALSPFQELFRTYWELETPVVERGQRHDRRRGLDARAARRPGRRRARVPAGRTCSPRRGMVPHAGDPFFLPRVLPLHRLNEVAMLSDTITSETLAGVGSGEPAGARARRSSPPRPRSRSASRRARPAASA